MDMHLQPLYQVFSKNGRDDKRENSRIETLDSVNVNKGQKKELKERDAYDELG